MNIGIIGLGKMGESIAYRLLKGNHNVLGFDPAQTARNNLVKQGCTAVADIESLVKQVEIIWIMVPAGEPVDTVLTQIRPHLNENTIVVDGGNSHYPDTIRRSKELAEQNIALLDCGTSGGLKGREIGFSLMVGGNKQAIRPVVPVDSPWLVDHIAQTCVILQGVDVIVTQGIDSAGNKVDHPGADGARGA